MVINMEDSGVVFNIQRVCVNDGPGIRTTVFLKGCNLNCSWCHNPESKLFKPELMYHKEMCLNCGACTTACPVGCHSIRDHMHVFDRSMCIGCGLCTKVCCGALELVGKKMTAEAVIATVLRDHPFYESSGGGVTFSGGEPFMQAPFLLTLLSLAKQSGLSTAIETNGCVSMNLICQAANDADLFLLDYKITNMNDAQKYIGAGYGQIFDTLQILNHLQKRVVLRCPIIPGINDNIAHFQTIASISMQYDNIDHVEVEPYHPLGIGKAADLDKKAEYTLQKMPAEDTIQQWMETIQRLTRRKVELG